MKTHTKMMFSCFFVQLRTQHKGNYSHQGTPLLKRHTLNSVVT